MYDVIQSNFQVILNSRTPLHNTTQQVTSSRACIINWT